MMLNIFHMHICSLCILYSEMFVDIFYVFPNWIGLNYLFLTVELWEFFIYSKYKYFIGYMICKFFSQSIICLCTLLIGSFAEQKFYNLVRSNLSNFLLIDYAFAVKFKNSSPGPEDVFLKVLSFYILCLGSPS